MNRWIFRALILFLGANLALACGDDDDDGTGSGGSVGKGGSAGKGGASSSGGGASEGGAPGSGGGGAPEPVTCDPPTPPDVGGGEGGAGGSGGAEASRGAASESEGLAIAGTYLDEFDGEHEITNAVWINYGTYNISQFDNEERYVIARNDEENSLNPCAWSRFDWTYDGDDLYYCQSAFAAESERAALDTEPADADDLEEGCSGFPWSKLTPQ
jgi:hypothetical protein